MKYRLASDVLENCFFSYNSLQNLSSHEKTTFMSFRLCDYQKNKES